MQEAGVVGLFRTIIFLIGIMVVLRFIGQLMSAKRNLDEEKQFHKQKKTFDEVKKMSEKNKGKIKLSDKKNKASDYNGFTDYEEIN